MPEAVTVSAGQHNLLCAAPMTTSLSAPLITHHLALLPRPSPPLRRAGQESLCAQQLLEVLKSNRQEFGSQLCPCCVASGKSPNLSEPQSPI